MACIIYFNIWLPGKYSLFLIFIHDWSRAQYRKDAQAAYTQKMLVAHKGEGEFPKIRTFNKADTSTNSVFRDLEAAERLWVC